MSDLRAVRLTGRALLRVAGPEARAFLQGLLSNDVDLLSPTRALYAALLTPQGKYLFDFILVDLGDAILLDAEAARAAELRQRLLMYRLRAKVTVEPEPGLSVLALLGADSAPRFGLAPEPGAARPSPAPPAFVDPRLAELGMRVLLPEADIEPFLAEHAILEAEPDAYDLLRLRLGVPDGSRDLVPQKSVLLESGFEELNGVSFTKGCFVGQELTARMKHRGLVKKRLFPVRVEGPLPEPGTIITAEGKEAGEMRSGVGDRGLALLRLDQARAALRGQLELAAEGSRVLPELPEWVQVTA